MTSSGDISPAGTATGKIGDVGHGLAQLISLLVDSPEDVVIRQSPEHKVGMGGVGFSVQVAPDDVGKLIGRQGRTVRALRSLLAARGALEGVGRYELEIRSG